MATKWTWVATTTPKLTLWQKKGAEIQYFQVATQLPENSNREIDNLISQLDNYQKTVLAANRMDVGKVNGMKVVHVVDVLSYGLTESIRNDN